MNKFDAFDKIMQQVHETAREYNIDLLAIYSRDAGTGYSATINCPSIVLMAMATDLLIRNFNSKELEIAIQILIDANQEKKCGERR